MLMHVPDWDPTRKQRPREESPFSMNDALEFGKSTYAQHCERKIPCAFFLLAFIQRHA